MEMSPDAWRRVKSVVAECLELEERERGTHLERACGDDGELRREAESLLASHRDAGEFLERPAIGEPEAGMRLGPWLLEAEVGHGGMGRIYRASRADGQYEQKAAVKVLRRGMDTDVILSHFQAERQILASLNHPNVARLLDGGATPDGRPFFVMEFIDGRPLDQYVNEREPAIGERLRLFQLVCGAVQYAHQRLVVHRDIKPANILVTDEGVPKLVDFGIAKLIGQGTAVTIAAERMLTPAYASPEQLAGEEVTTASDVYSLGVVLYQLLAGHAPYAPDSRDRSGEPEMPSTAAGEARDPAGGRLRELLRGDLDNIVLKALEHDPARRYESAAQLSEDIQRYLEGHPVAARKQTFTYRASRFVRRNRVLVGAAALVAVALAGGFAATLWQYRIAQGERRQAEQRFGKLRKLANSVIHEFHDSIADLPGATEARALMLTRALEYLDGLAAEAGNDVALRLELAAAYQRVGDVQGGAGRPNLGQSAASERSYTKAVQILQGMTGEAAGSTEARTALARALIRVGGDENTRRAVEIAGGLGRAGVLADTYFARANFLTESGDMEGATAIRRKDLEIRRELLAADPGNRSLRRNLALVSKRLGGLLIRLGRLDEAYTHYAAAMEIEKALVAEAPLSLEARTALSFSKSDIGYIRRQQGRLAEALGHYRETVALRETLYAADAKNYRTRLVLASACWRTGELLVRMGRAAEAVPMLDRAEELLTGPGAPPVETFTQREEAANVHHSSARANLGVGRREAALGLFERARAEFAQLAREATGREDLRSRVSEIEKDIRRLRR